MFLNLAEFSKHHFEGRTVGKIYLINDKDKNELAGWRVTAFDMPVDHLGTDPARWACDLITVRTSAIFCDGCLGYKNINKIKEIFKF